MPAVQSGLQMVIAGIVGQMADEDKREYFKATQRNGQDDKNDSNPLDHLHKEVACENHVFYPRKGEGLSLGFRRRLINENEG